jgi:hypothetical protein
VNMLGSVACRNWDVGGRPTVTIGGTGSSGGGAERLPGDDTFVFLLASNLK